MSIMNDLTWLGTDARAAKRSIGLRIASSMAIGWSVALLEYAALQLATATGWISFHLDSGAIPLFFRWRSAALGGTATAVAACVVDLHRRVPWLGRWMLIAACTLTTLAVVFAP
jgi:hypothetical protein